MRASTRRWVVTTAIGAVLATVADAVLLERSKGYFRGGFLAVDYLEGPAQTAAFLIVSLVADAAVIGTAVALVAWLLRSTRLRPAARSVAGALVGVGAVLLTDVVTYEIVRFLGDAFDLGLMFDLAGGRLAELFAVASGHLMAPAISALVGLMVVGGVIWGANRLAAAGAEDEPWLLPLTVLVCGAVIFSAAATQSDVLENGLLRKPSGRVLAMIANAASDVDRDGYGIVGRSSDPDPFDGAVFPYAVDIPGNDIDEDGVGGDLPGGTTALADAPVPAGAFQLKPDVVLIVLESFRADVVGGTFQGKAITPILDGLAARGLSRRAAYSHNGYTAQSRFHLFTGSLAAPAGARTLIDDFKANGYTVGYLSGQDESFGGPRYDIGFSRATVARDAREDPSLRYTTGSTPGSLAVPLGVVERRVDELLAQTSHDTPLLLIVNFHDTHFPYTHKGLATLVSPARLPRESIRPESRDQLWATYTNTAANVDRAIGAVIAAVRSSRRREPGIVITSDHGESLFDEGFLGHGYSLNEVQTRVPLVVANLPIAVPDPFVQVDLRPALLHAMQSPTGTPARPVSVPRDPRQPIFQYLGDLTRPRQLAFLGTDGRFIYDFRSGRVQVSGGSWLRPRELSTHDAATFLELIRYWERTRLPRSSDAHQG